MFTLKMPNDSNSTCPICNRILRRQATQQNFNTYYGCERCGNFGLSIMLTEGNQLANLEDRIIACFLLKHPDSKLDDGQSNTPVIWPDDIDNFRKNYKDPTALELLDNFLYFYCTVGAIGQKFLESQFELCVATKTLSFKTATWAVKQVYNMGWLASFDEREGNGGYYSAQFEISARGWQVFYENQKRIISGKQAFLALQFNNESLREIIVPEIKAACEKAGFELLAVNENRQAGLIDNKIRVDIRNSRFIVVDISDQNRGAYFEAGFAEGLDKPVFYICDKSVFDKHHSTEAGEKTIHFDVEHHDIITWDKNNPEKVREELLASIRNTLPSEAKMTD